MADFVIIGGGVYGVATAWWLARGGCSVQVLEEREVAARASGGPGRRGVRANGRDLRELALMGQAYERWSGLHDELGAEPFYERTGHLLLAETEADEQRLRAQALIQGQLGIHTEMLDQGAVHEREPGLSAAIRAAAYCPGDGVADQTAVTRAYGAAASRLGVEISTGTRATSIELHHGLASAVLTAGGERVAAERGVLVLANSEVSALVRPWLELPVWNDTLQVLISEPMAKVPFRHLTGHVSRTVSLKREGLDRVMISGGWRGRWNAATGEGTTIPRAVAGNLAEAVKVYPALEGVGIDLADAGHQESACIDGVPIIDTVPGVANVWYATGWCGHGWAIAPVICDLIASWAARGRCPEALRPFSNRRFAP